MSHVVTGSVIIKDLECLKKVLKKFPKVRWMDGQKKYKWFGKFMDDYAAKDAAYKNGINTEDYGHCEHAIRMDGVNYEIGVMKRRDGEGYSLVWDFYADGKNISNYIGKGAEKLMTEYSKEFAMDFASAEGYMVNQTEDKDFIYLSLEQ